MQRIEAIRHMAQVITKDDLVTTSIGQTWDDWWNHKPADNTFFTGILGSVTPTALGLAVSLPHRRIIAIESDGSVLLNIGGPPTHTSFNTDLARMAEGAGCLNCVTVRDADDFDRHFRRMLDDGQMGYLVAKIEPFAKHQWEWKDRKATDGIEDKYRFLRYVEKLEGVVIHPG